MQTQLDAAKSSDAASVADFLARGGTLTFCPEGTALHAFNASVAHQNMGPHENADMETDNAD